MIGATGLIPGCHSLELHRIGTRRFLELLGGSNRLRQTEALLRLRVGCLVTTDQMAEYLYGADFDGGPEGLYGVWGQRIKILRHLGLPIGNEWGRGHYLMRMP